ncbi:MAG: site-specific integrase, partial [Candidatus Electrothrix sp. AUS1_2]|nr:site-specific integrase [Candidatus Electrothrix sp. AUS1_2]
MASMKRYKTKYAGVFYIEGTAAKGNRSEKIYYIRYRKDGKLVEEKAGRQYQDEMTPARAAGIRAERIEGRQKNNEEQRKEAEAVKHRWTVHRVWNEYQARLTNQKTKKTDTGRYERFLKKPFGNKEPKDIVKLDTDRVRINLLKTHSPQTVKHVLVLLKRIINFGYGQGWIAPLAFKITIPRVDNIKTEDLTPEQLQSLFDVLETTHRTTAVYMMKLVLFTGLRRGEMFKLQWDDIDFERGFIHIREPKGGKSQKIPLNNSARELLQSVPKQDSEYIFPARGGGPRKDISKDVRAIKEAAGLPAEFRPLHGLRHVYATMLANSGKVDMFTL